MLYFFFYLKTCFSSIPNSLWTRFAIYIFIPKFRNVFFQFSCPNFPKKEHGIFHQTVSNFQNPEVFSEPVVENILNQSTWIIYIFVYFKHFFLLSIFIRYLKFSKIFFARKTNWKHHSHHHDLFHIFPLHTLWHATAFESISQKLQPTSIATCGTKH